MFEELLGRLGEVVRPYRTRFTAGRAAAAKRRAVEEELPDWLHFAATALRGGLSIRLVLSEAAGRLSGPLAAEMTLAASELDAGLTVDQALRGLTDRVDSRDVTTAASVLAVALRHGGDAAAALDALAGVAAERLAIRREVSSLTAQARFSAVVLGVLPVGFFLLFPGGAGAGALARPAGWLIIIIGLTLNAIGFLTLRWMAAPERLC
jgi:tight adherence protein B